MAREETEEEKNVWNDIISFFDKSIIDPIRESSLLLNQLNIDGHNIISFYTNNKNSFNCNSLVSTSCDFTRVAQILNEMLQDYGKCGAVLVLREKATRWRVISLSVDQIKLNRILRLNSFM